MGVNGSSGVYLSIKLNSQDLENKLNKNPQRLEIHDGIKNQYLKDIPSH